MLAKPAPMQDDGSDGGDSDYENLLEHLDADAMQNDPDIQKEKSELKKKKMKKKAQLLMGMASEAKAAKKEPLSCLCEP